MNINRIFHIADIHIRNYKRHNEYREIFDRLFKYLKNNIQENDVIYLAGDIVHSKTDMSPELIDLVSFFLKGCADIAPTILITGNHDTNLNNNFRLDALTPIVNTLNHSNLFYWKYTDVYEFKGVHFSVMSVYDEPKDWIPAEKITGAYKIALHHGAVNSALTDMEYEIENEHVSLNIFDGYDLVLLGDIHKRQYLNKECTIAYAGSLIQQNHGEEYGHGILVWDLNTKTSEYVEIYNDIAYATIEVDNGKIITDRNYISNLPKQLRLRIKYTNSTYSQIQKIIDTFKTKYTLIECNAINVNNDLDLSESNSSVVLGDVRDVEYQNSLITQYLLNLPDSDKINIDGIRYINRMINSKLNTGNFIRNVIWKPLLFEFSNMFSYGENNKIDFTNFKGIKGIFAPNASGKSTLLDAVTYCIFDKCSRTYKASDVLNNKSNEFYCKLSILINDEIYTIERIGVKHKRTGAVKVDVNFSKIENGELINLNSSDRDSTNKIIRDYIGTYDDFLLTALSTQNDNKNFIFKTQRERKELLNSFLDITVFDDLYKITKDEIKEKTVLLKNLESELNKSSYDNILNNLNTAQSIYTETSASVNIYESELNSINNNINTLKDSIINVNEIINIDEILNEIDSSILKKEEVSTLIIDYKKNLKELNSSKLNISKKINSIDKQEFEKNKNELITLNSQIQLLIAKNSELKSDIKQHQKQIAHLDTHEYDPNCQYCINNEFVKNAIQSKLIINDLIEENAKNEEQLKNLKTVYIEKSENVSEIENKYSELNTNLTQTTYDIEMTNKRIENANLLIHNLSDKIKNLQKSKKLYSKNKNIQDNNLIAINDIEKLKFEFNEKTKKYKELHSSLINLNSELVHLQRTYDEWELKKQSLSNLYSELFLYEHYINAVSINGVPYILIKKIMPIIEHEINIILSNIVDFHVKLEVDSKNINCYINYSDNSWPVELASGMERFIISIAARVALVNVSSLPRPNFIAIDEGFGVLDSDNIPSIESLFNYIKTQFDYILCITHLDSMKDLADSLIGIDKDNLNRSKITFY
jgi:DNA repair exonuclease SbcCD ATPase subunit